MQPVEWKRYRAVVFDVDGTLYDQRLMRRRMAIELAARCLRRPRTWSDARLLALFRGERERLAEAGGGGVERRQYELPAERLGLAPARVEAVVREWMLERPLRHLPACRWPRVDELFSRLHAGGWRIGVFSDYPVAAKLAALGLDSDATVAATDADVDRLKPDPAGLLRLLERLAVAPAEALVVGDRDDRDGESARRAGCDYRLLARRPRRAHEFGGYAELLAGVPSGGR